MYSRPRQKSVFFEVAHHKMRQQVGNGHHDNQAQHDCGGLIGACRSGMVGAGLSNSRQGKDEQSVLLERISILSQITIMCMDENETHVAQMMILGNTVE